MSRPERPRRASSRRSIQAIGRVRRSAADRKHRGQARDRDRRQPGPNAAMREHRHGLPDDSVSAHQCRPRPAAGLVRPHRTPQVRGLPARLRRGCLAALRTAHRRITRPPMATDRQHDASCSRSHTIGTTKQRERLASRQADAIAAPRVQDDAVADPSAGDLRRWGCLHCPNAPLVCLASLSERDGAGRKRSNAGFFLLSSYIHGSMYV